MIYTGDKDMPLELYKRFLEFVSLGCLQAITRLPSGLDKHPQCHIYDFIQQMNIACRFSESILYAKDLKSWHYVILSDLKKEKGANALDQK